MNKVTPLPIEQCNLTSALCWIPDPLPIDANAGYWDVLHRTTEGWVSSNWQYCHPTLFIELPHRPDAAPKQDDYPPTAEAAGTPRPPYVALLELLTPHNN